MAMYYINKFIGYIVSPVGLAFVLLVLGWILNGLKGCGVRWTKGGKWWMIAAAVWLWLWATPLMSRIVGASLERPYLVDGRVPRIESFPQADAILLLGGGMGADTNLSSYAEMWTSADRVWQAARLYKAGKALRVIATGGGIVDSTAGLLFDFGVPKEAVVFDEDPRNTEEEAKAAAKRKDKTVLVVTSAWHMKRALMMFRKYAPAVKAIPAPSDFENSLAAVDSCSFFDFIPNPPSLMWNTVTFHEWLGIIGYTWFR